MKANLENRDYPFDVTSASLKNKTVTVSLMLLVRALLVVGENQTQRLLLSGDASGAACVIQRVSDGELLIAPRSQLLLLSAEKRFVSAALAVLPYFELSY